jgi:hypothetical protein
MESNNIVDIELGNDNLPPIDSNPSGGILHIPSSAFQIESSSSDEECAILQSSNDIHFTENSSPVHWEYTNMYMKSNSPIASNCNSDLDEQSLDLAHSRPAFRRKRNKPPYKKFTYENIENSLSKYYDQNERSITEMDVILTYLKGIRLLYAHSKTSCQMKLYSLLMVTVGISMGLSIIAPFVKDLRWGFYLLSAGNATITILISVSRYLQLEYKSVGFSFMANQCGKLETKLEFEHGWNDVATPKKPRSFEYPSYSSEQPEFQMRNRHSQNDGRDNYAEELGDIATIFQNNPQHSRLSENDLSPKMDDYFNAADFKPNTETLQDVEIKITEMRELFNALVPEDVIRLFPLIYNTNIFRSIKKMEQYKKNLIIRFRDIKNEIHYILYKLNSAGKGTQSKTLSPRQIREKNRILYLMGLKEQTKKDLILCKNTYTQIDDLFNKEIRYAETHQSCFGCAGLFRPNYDFSKLNPVVRDYLKLVIPD